MTGSLLVITFYALRSRHQPLFKTLICFDKPVILCPVRRGTKAEYDSPKYHALKYLKVS